MADETNNEMIDLDFDMSEVDLSRPVLKAGTYDATIAFTRKDVTKKSNTPVLLVGFRLAQTAEDTKGNTVNPGFTITQRIITQPSGKLTQKMINERLARIANAATGAKAGKPNTGEWIGKPVRVAIKLRDEHKDEATGETYPASNEVNNVYPPPQAQTAAA